MFQPRHSIRGAAGFLGDQIFEMSKARMVLGVLGWCALTAVGLVLVLNFDGLILPVLITGNVLIALVVGLTLRRQSQQPNVRTGPPSGILTSNAMAWAT